MIDLFVKFISKKGEIFLYTFIANISKKLSHLESYSIISLQVLNLIKVLHLK